MSIKNAEKRVPDELPSHEHPSEQKPLKDPFSPNEDNPINPQPDEDSGE